MTRLAVLLAQGRPAEPPGWGISVDPSASGGPGGAALTTLINYAAWFGYRAGALAFLISTVVMAFGRFNEHPGSEAAGRKGMLRAALVVAAIAAADRLLGFAATIGGQV